jgi:hypothetical protein
MTSALAGLPELLQIGRENALLGNYQTALTYYDGVNAQVATYLVSSSLCAWSGAQRGR